MRVFSHTCSNTEIVCALGAGDLLVGVDADSDFPPETVGPLPKPGRDLDLDVSAVLALQPDLVLTSLTVPGHERIVEELRAAGVPLRIIDPRSLEDVYASVQTIADALGIPARGVALVGGMRAAMPAVAPRGRRPRLLVEWWPKPVIAPARESWVNELLWLAGAENPWASRDGKSIELADADIFAAPPDAVVMSWCGVREENYRADVVVRRAGWNALPAVRDGKIFPITEAFLGRPGPRLVEGYRAMRKIISQLET